MGLVLGLGFMILLAFAVPALMTLGGSILLFYFWHKKKQAVFLIMGILCLCLMLLCLLGVGVGLLLMYGPLSYGGMI